ncbi:MAG TPA: hypothetical protein VMF13_03365, partial [Luteitalea sp.]|nr:hypothetical protein [Luteitalea sp.]
VTVRWTAVERGIDGNGVAALLDAGEPRILLNAGGGGGPARPQADATGDTGVSLTTSMLAAGDDAVIASRLHEILSEKRTLPPAKARQAPTGDLTGQWAVEIAFLASTSTHHLHLNQRDGRVEGLHRGNLVSRDIAGTMDGDAVTLTSRITERTGDSLNYRFTGRLQGDALAGDVDMGEYGKATFTARRVVQSGQSQ